MNESSSSREASCLINGIWLLTSQPAAFDFPHRCSSSSAAGWNPSSDYVELTVRLCSAGQRGRMALFLTWGQPTSQYSSVNSGKKLLYPSCLRDAERKAPLAAVVSGLPFTAQWTIVSSVCASTAAQKKQNRSRGFLDFFTWNKYCLISCHLFV